MKNARSKLAMLAVCAALALTATSSAIADASEVYAGLGTTGLGVGYGYGISTNFGVRAEFDGYSYSMNQTSGGTKYDGRLHLQSLGVYGDWFPWAGAFRVTAGYVSAQNKFTGRASGHDGDVTINHQSYSLVGQSASVDVKWPSSVPYLGIGWGHNPTRNGFHFIADIGLQFGSPKSRITLSPGLAAQVPASDVRAQENTFNSDLKVLGGYPVAFIGVGYRF